MNKGERTGSIILIIVMIIICVITIFVKYYESHPTLTSEMVEKSKELDSFKRDIEETDSLIKDLKKKELKKSKKDTSINARAKRDNVLPVIKDD